MSILDGITTATAGLVTLIVLAAWAEHRANVAERRRLERAFRGRNRP